MLFLNTFVVKQCPAFVCKVVTRLHRASFWPVDQALSVKMLITLEPHGIFGSNFVYF